MVGYWLNLLTNLSGPLIYASTIMILIRRRPVFNREFWTLLLIGLSASLPLMISPRQYAHYLMTSLPFLTLAIAIATSIWARNFEDKLSRRPKSIIAATGLMIAIMVTTMFSKFGETTDDEEVIHDASQIADLIQPGSVIVGNCQGMEQPYRLQMYLNRYWSIPSSGQQEEFIICDHLPAEGQLKPKLSEWLVYQPPRK